MEGFQMISAIRLLACILLGIFLRLQFDRWRKRK
uniref:Tumor necrosis factor receptor member 16 trans-membrane domain n=1 Tax=Myoviridae sp. ctwwN25 TaxID=2825209 RepID=A0A8S5PNE1_9CAUD|nr:MAG TPA: Tumor necrosis factor receptor member 16 trans-membrane domain [Myoviridae sp. ctwwN25]